MKRILAVQKLLSIYKVQNKIKKSNEIILHVIMHLKILWTPSPVKKGTKKKKSTKVTSAYLHTPSLVFH